MIKHIVLFQLKDKSTDIDSARKKLLGLKGKVPQLRSLEVGINLIHSARSFDIALVTEFDSLEDLAAYQSHPEHQKVAEYMISIRDSSITVDYEVSGVGSNII